MIPRFFLVLTLSTFAVFANANEETCTGCEDITGQPDYVPGTLVLPALDVFTYVIIAHDGACYFDPTDKCGQDIPCSTRLTITAKTGVTNADGSVNAGYTANGQIGDVDIAGDPVRGTHGLGSSGSDELYNGVTRVDCDTVFPYWFHMTVFHEGQDLSGDPNGTWTSWGTAAISGNMHCTKCATGASQS